MILDPDHPDFPAAPHLHVLGQGSGHDQGPGQHELQQLPGSQEHHRVLQHVQRP